MDLASLDSIKLRLDLEDSVTKHDELLALLITAVSKEVEKFLNRTAESSTYTEYFDVYDTSTVFSLKAYPVTSVTSVNCDIDWGWTGANIDSGYYRVKDGTGLLYVRNYMVTPGTDALKVVYAGGMGATFSAFRSSFPDVVRAVERQVCFCFNTASKIGATSINLNTGGASFLNDDGLMDGVKAALWPHRRLVYVA